MESKKKNSRSTKSSRPRASRTLGWIKVGTNVIAAKFPIHRLFDGDYPLRGDSLAMEPHGDTRLPNTKAGQFTQPSGQCSLSAGLINCLSEGGNVHAPNYNTDSVISVNTRCVMRPLQTKEMPKRANTTDFWKRLTLARETCNPPKSMRQADIAKEYDAAYQSTVTKWKTGGPNGDSMPEPDKVLKMALDCNVNVNWLWAGQGEMRPKQIDPVVEQLIQATERLDYDEKVGLLKDALAIPAMRNISATEKRQEKSANTPRRAQASR